MTVLENSWLLVVLVRRSPLVAAPPRYVCVSHPDFQPHGFGLTASIREPKPLKRLNFVCSWRHRAEARC
jgi:hypothetical protein